MTMRICSSINLTLSARKNPMQWLGFNSGALLLAAIGVFPFALALGATNPSIAPATEKVLSVDQSGCAAINYFDVGPGKSYTKISAVPWSTLKGCDTVRIYPKAGNAPYHEMILLSAGTNVALTAANRFMRVMGMPDPTTGALPIIDGTHATQLETTRAGVSRPLQYWDSRSTPRALYQLGLVMVSAQLGYTYKNGPASYIGIENLNIRNAVYNAPFTDGVSGKPSAYRTFTSCIYVEAGAHVVIKNNDLHNCGNGLFINSKNAVVAELSQDVLVDGNRIYDNGNAKGTGTSGGFSEHNSYTEVRGIVYQNNHFGNMRRGAKGDCIKDRSSGLIVRYNTFSSDCTLPLHLMDPTGGKALIRGQADFLQTFVYGNLFEFNPAQATAINLVRYGGDSAIYSLYRNGTLHFYNNTLVIKGKAESSQYPEAFLFTMQQPEAVADVRNNAFYASPSTPAGVGKIQAFALGAGTVTLKNNWVSPNSSQFWKGHQTGAKINGWNTNLGKINAPGFVNEKTHNFHLTAGSGLINRGADLGSLPPPRREPSGPLRKKTESIDIGAFEF